jgi:hypothetical protein
MRKAYTAAFAIFAFSLVLISPAFAQGQQGAGTGSTLRDDLMKNYKLVKLGSNAGSTSVTDQGTVLTVQMVGLVGLPSNSFAPCVAHFKDGSLHAPNMFCKAAARNNFKDFPNGDKVYPMKIDVNLQKEEVAFTVLECDSCNNTDPPTYYHSEIVFQFPKGYLENADAGQVEDMIAKVFAQDNSNSGDNANGNNSGNGGDQGNNANANGNGNANGGDQGNGGGQQQQPQQQQPPATVQIGQTPDQVTQILGQPDKIIDLGAKKIYVYKDIKVTFVNGKVTDAQ